MIAEQVNISAQSQNFDLDMELLNPAKIRTVGAKSVKIIGTEKNRKHAVSIRVFGTDSKIEEKPCNELILVKKGVSWKTFS